MPHSSLGTQKITLQASPFEGSTRVHVCLKIFYELTEIRTHRHQILKFFWGWTKRDRLHAFAQLEDNETVLLALEEPYEPTDWAKSSDISVSGELLNFEGQLHKGFFERSKIIPISCLIEILKSGKKLILTGFSHGSAVAEILFIRLLKSPLFLPMWLDSVTFMGFSSPPIGMYSV